MESEPVEITMLDVIYLRYLKKQKYLWNFCHYLFKYLNDIQNFNWSK